MINLDHIPTDIWEAADAVLAEIVRNRVSIDGDSEVTISGVDLIALAILAERTKCASQVFHVAKHVKATR